MILKYHKSCIETLKKKVHNLELGIFIEEKCIALNCYAVFVKKYLTRDVWTDSLKHFTEPTEILLGQRFFFSTVTIQ